MSDDDRCPACRQHRQQEVETYKRIADTVSNPKYALANYVVFPNFDGDNVHVLTERGRLLLSREALTGYMITKDLEAKLEAMTKLADSAIHYFSGGRKQMFKSKRDEILDGDLPN